MDNLHDKPEQEQLMSDQINYGMSVTQGGKRIDPMSIYKEPEQEPVAWVSSEELLVMRGNALGGAKDWRINVGLVKQDGDVGLYTTPPQRKPLTDEEIRDALEAEFLHSDEKRNWHDDVRVARAIEAAHGIKGEA